MSITFTQELFVYQTQIQKTLRFTQVGQNNETYKDI
jgi:hypothetical protein